MEILDPYYLLYEFSDILKGQKEKLLIDRTSTRIGAFVEYHPLRHETLVLQKRCENLKFAIVASQLKQRGYTTTKPKFLLHQNMLPLHTIDNSQ